MPGGEPLELDGRVTRARRVAPALITSTTGGMGVRIEQAPDAWRAKLGGSYSLQSLPVKLGFDASYLPEDWVRNSARQRVYESSRRTLNLNASWNASKTTILRLNLDNLLHQRTSRIDEYLEQGSLVRLSTWNTHHARVVVRFETSL